MACLVGTAIPTTSGLVSRRTLTFADRVAYQYAIEEVYWRHRIWPKDNPRPKPALDAEVSREQVEKKVLDYLRKSQALGDYWQRPITAEQLQAEMDRMASHTKQPDVLGELFQAFGNDPFVIAECLARPILTARMVAEREGGSSPEAISGLDGKTNRAAIANSWPSAPGNIARGAVDPPQNDPSSIGIRQDNAAYKLPETSIPSDCIDDSWAATTTVNAPDARDSHTAVWTGSEMIIWGGFSYSSNYLNTGAKYDPATDSWTATSTVNAPTPRGAHAAVWTGSEMIVWGGNYSNTGARYNPITDSWTATTMVSVPAARSSHTAVWTGTEMIVWGGYISGCCWTNTGGRYNPATNSWAATSIFNLPAARSSHTAIWTGSEMIVWGGYDGGCCSLNTGGRYNPNNDHWTPTALPPDSVEPRQSHTAVWTGSEMIVWGGYNYPFVFNTGGRYDPSTDSWMPTSFASVSGRIYHTAVWTGSEMIIWGGQLYSGTDINTGGRYNPDTDSWTLTTTTNAPVARDSHTAVWTGNEMIIWGGTDNDFAQLNTGGRYCAPPQTAVLVADTATLTAESCTPPNGAPDPGETDTVNFCVRNTGNGSTANLVGTLFNTGGVTDASPPQSYGAIPPGAAICRSFSFTANGTCGGTITASIQLQDGGANRGTAMWSFPLGTTVASSENFDGVTPPALPPSWTVDQGVNTEGFPSWVTSASGLPSPPAYSLPNAAYTEDPANILDNRIYSPVVMYAAGSQLTFRQNFDLEQQDPYTSYDAGVLEINVSGGGWVDILSAGGSFAGGGYNHFAINRNYGNPLPNGPNWSGNSGGFITTIVNLPDSSAGQSVQFRWRMGSDNVVSRNGWRIDDVAIVQHVCCISAPTVNSAVSRKTHGAAGTFDVDLPLAGTSGMECRTGGATNDYTMVITFSANVTVNGNPQAAVTSGIGTIGSNGINNGGMVSVIGNIVTVPLTNVANAQTINVTLYGVNGATTVLIPMRVLIGDTNGNGSVNASDIGQTKSRSGQTADGTNFRSDVNANGAINATDVSIVKSSAGTGVP